MKLSPSSACGALTLAQRLASEPCSLHSRPAWEAWRAAYWLAGGAGPASSEVCRKCRDELKRRYDVPEMNSGTDREEKP